jgi:capsid protein
MSRRARNRQSSPLFARANKEALASPALVERDLTPSAMVGSFPGAEWSRDRGYVYFPTLESEKEVDSWSRIELMKRTRAMYNGIGYVRGLINGIARMVCGTGLAVQPMTSSPEWNRKAQAVFARRTASREVFHLGRKYSFPASQRAVMRAMLKDGDCLGVLARTETNALRVALYEGNQIGNGSIDSKGLVDGVRLDRHRGAVSYRAVSLAENGTQSHVDIPARDSLFIADFERIGQARGVSCLYHAVNRILDRGEILAATTKGIKLSSQIGYAIETAAGSPGPQAGNLAPRRPQTTVELANGRKVTLEKLAEGGEIESLQPGQSLKIVHDGRPHQNTTNHLDALVRDVSLGTGFFPEVLYNVAGLGGANTRFVMAGTQGRVEELQETLVETYTAPVYLAHIADAIAEGELEFHPEWFLHTWLTPARLTVDFGRDGKLYIEQYKQGMVTLRTLYGWRGEEWRPEIDDYLDERAYIKAGAAKRGLTMAEAMPAFFGTNVGAQPEPDADDTEDPEDDPDPADDTDPEDDDA